MIYPKLARSCQRKERENKKRELAGPLAELAETVSEVRSG